MALQVDSTQSGNVAEEGHVEAYDVAQKIGVCDELVDGVIGGVSVHGRPFVPARKIVHNVLRALLCIPRSVRWGDFGHEVLLPFSGAGVAAGPLPDDAGRPRLGLVGSMGKARTRP